MLNSYQVYFVHGLSEDLQITSLQTHAVVTSHMDPVKVITRLGIEDREFVPMEDGRQACFVWFMMKNCRGRCCAFSFLLACIVLCRYTALASF